METAQKWSKYTTLQEVIEEVKRIVDIGFPIVTVSLVAYLKNMISVACLGRLGNLHLAGGALAIGFANITGYSVLSGLASGMEPLCSQGFGSNNISLQYGTLQKATLMLLFTSFPIGFLWINLETILLLFNQDPIITRVASLYCRFLVPDLIATSLILPIRIYFRSQGRTWPLMWSNLVAIVLHIPITILLTFTLSLGVPGIAISTFITDFNTLLLLLLYISLTPTSHKLQDEEVEITQIGISNIKWDDYKLQITCPLPFSPNINTLLEEWKTLLRFAIPSCLGVCLEWWWYEFMTISAGYLPNPHVALATAAIVIQTTALMYTLPAALSASISTRVGNELGARHPEKARLATMVAIGMALVTSMLGLLLTTLGREAWGRIFTSDSEILELTVIVLPIIGLCEVANCPQTTSCGILRGSARPGIGAVINFCSFYMVGAPIAIVLAFIWKIGFVGLCYGLLAAQIACVVSILMVVYRTNWEKESMKAKDLVEMSTGGETCEAQLHQRGKFEEGVGLITG